MLPPTLETDYSHPSSLHCTLYSLIKHAVSPISVNQNPAPACPGQISGIPSSSFSGFASSLLFFQLSFSYCTAPHQVSSSKCRPNREAGKWRSSSATGCKKLHHISHCLSGQKLSGTEIRTAITSDRDGGGGLKSASGDF